MRATLTLALLVGCGHGVAAPPALAGSTTTPLSPLSRDAPLDLRTATRLALLYAPEVVVARAQAASAEAATVVARQRKNPTLDVELALLPPIPKLTLGLPVSAPGRRAARVAAARADADAAAAGVYVVSWRVWMRLTRDLIDGVTADERVRSLDHTVSLLRAALSLLNGRVKAGALPTMALLPARQRLTEALLQRGEARREATLARSDLSAVIGVPGARGLRLGLDLRVPLGAPSAGATLSERADVIAARARLRAAEQRLRLAGRGRWLDGWLGGSGEWDPAGTIWTPTLSTDLPLFHGRGAAVGQAVAHYEEVGAELVAVQTAALAEIDAATLRLQSGRERLAESATALADAVQAEESVMARMEAGAGDPLEVLEARLVVTGWRLGQLELLRALRHAEVDVIGARQRPAELGAGP